MATGHPPTDAVGDTMPDSFFDEKRRYQRLIFLLFCFIGGLLIALGAYSRWKAGQSWVPELCLGFGVAIGTPGFLTYLYRRYLFDDIKAEMTKPTREFKEDALKIVSDVANEAVRVANQTFINLQDATKHVVEGYESEVELLQAIRGAGVYGVYRTRSEALTAFRDFIKNEKQEIVVIGSSLRGLLQERDPEYAGAREALLERRRGDVKMRFLLTHPKIADLRARQEGRPFRAIGGEIIKSLHVLLHDWQVTSDDVKLYEGTPTCFGIKTASAMLLNFYPYMQESLASPCLIVTKGYFYDAFDKSHFRAWRSEIAQDVPVNLAQLEAKLDEYARNTRDLIGSG